MPKDTSPNLQTDDKKLPPWAYVICGWPLLLVAVGGGLGGAKFGINVAIYQSSMPVAAKILLNILTGVAAAGIWFAITLAIQSSRT